MLVEYIDAHRDRFGVEPICRVLASAGMHRPEQLLRREDQLALSAGGG